ncbi:MAG: ATP-binding protein [Candidatus Nanopelagicales bacterium]|nr:ATP-binding protein [Candidatus Nanopelagicales bacterium]MDZ4249401.1 ATP-binding protein [Candidatus Nanopelagicales bacterium]
MRALGLGARLLTIQILVLIAGAAALVVTAFLIAPPIFRLHLGEPDGANSELTRHAQEAFATGLTTALSVGGLVALAVAIATSALLVRRIASPVGALAEAARKVAGGNYDVAIEPSGLGPDFDALESAFRDMARQLRTSEEGRQRLVADLVHELRTPVAVLDAYVQGLEDGVIGQSASTWAVLHDQTHRLTRLAGDLSELSSVDEHALALALSPEDLDDVARIAVMSALPRYEAKGVELTFVGGEGLLCQLDRARIGQVLTNLLDNALRHTPSGGRVTVTTARHGRRMASVSVADSGEGIPPEDLVSVFDRFHRGDPARHREGDSGSGLGLTIARGIARAHGGDLVASSSGSGRGATMRLALLIS